MKLDSSSFSNYLECSKLVVNYNYYDVNINYYYLNFLNNNEDNKSQYRWLNMKKDKAISVRERV